MRTPRKSGALARGDALMCGFAACPDPERPAPPRSCVAGRRGGRPAHRGPDDAGFLAGRAWVSPRRLWIIDVAGGHQPIVERGRHRLDRLQRRGLQPRRAAPRARAHGPPLPDALRHRGHPPRLRGVGPDCVDRLRGMFAFAIWDAAAPPALPGARPLGIKPLYLRARAAASSSPRRSRRCSRTGVRRARPAGPLEHLTLRYAAAPRTLFAGIHKLPPARLTVDRAAPGAPLLGLGFEAASSRSATARPSSR